MSPLQIKGAVWLSLNEDARRSLLRLERWDLTFLKRRLVAKGHSASHVEVLVREYRKYLALGVVASARNHGMAGPVDDVWHEHILHTRDYDQFCRAVFGSFIHHVPADSPELLDEGESYAATVEELKRIFTDFSATAWPERSSAFCDSCKDCSHWQPGEGPVPAQVHA